MMRTSPPPTTSGSSSHPQCRNMSGVAQHEKAKAWFNKTATFLHEQRRNGSVKSVVRNRPTTATSSCCSPTACTTKKETIGRPIFWGDEPHIFDSLQPPPGLSSVTPCSTFDSIDTLSTMNSSLSPGSNSSLATNTMIRHVRSFSENQYGSMGLPSEYPLIKAVSSFSSIQLEDEDDDFDAFLSEKTSVFSKPAEPPVSPSRCKIESTTMLMDDDDLLSGLSTRRESITSFSSTSSSQATPPTPSQQKRRRPKHRRQRSIELGSIVSFNVMVTKSRRIRNRALCASEFQEQILDDLFSDDGSVHPLTY